MREGVFTARQGFVWFTRGFALWRSAFIPLTASAMTMFMCVMLGMLIPLINLFVIIMQRCIFAWSFERLLPASVAKVSARTAEAMMPRKRGR